jgi:hypothetical protein
LCKIEKIFASINLKQLDLQMRKIIYSLLLLLPLSVFGQIIHEKDVKISEQGAKKLKKAPKKVYFREFSIGYQSIIEANTTGIDRKASTKISMTAGLDSELTETDIQAITDKAYKRVVEKLENAGFTIITSAEAKEIDEYQKRVNTTVGGEPTYLNGYVYTQPSGTEYYKVTSGLNEAVKGAKNELSKQSKTLGNLPALGLLEKGSISDNTGKISEQLGNIPVMDFGMNINFAKITEDKKAGGSSVLKGEFGLNAHPYISRITWKGKGKLGNVETAISLYPKNYKPFEIEGVIPRQKIKKTAAGKYRTDWGSGIVYAQQKDIKITNPVKADRDIYIAKVSQAVDEYLDILVAQLLENSK